MNKVLYLVGSMYLLLLSQGEDGFKYVVYNRENVVEECAGEITDKELSSIPVSNPLAAARALAVRAAGLDGQDAARVSVRMLEPFPGDIRRRSIWEPETLPVHDIRFITSDYRELFRIPDGGTILVSASDRQFAAKCEYLDENHTRIGGEVYHICQYAEILKYLGAVCRPEPELEEEEAAWEVGTRNYLVLQTCEDGWDYTLYDNDFREVDGGQIDMPELSILEAREHILESLYMDRRNRKRVDMELIMEKTGL